MFDSSRGSRFLIFCSGASEDILMKCPSYERIKYSTIGFTILITSILGLVSSFFALSLITEELSFILLGSVLWSLIIFNLDRFIVISLKPSESTFKNILKSFPRLLIAILIGLIISKPIEIKLFENEINNFFQLDKIQKKNALQKELDLELQLIEENKYRIENKFEEKKLLVDRYKDEYLCEAAGTCGTKIRGRGAEYESRKERWVKASTALKKERIKRDSLLQLKNNEEKKLLLNFDKEQAIILKLEPGFFDKIKSLKFVNKIASNFILFLFILVEISPILTKIFSRRGPYDILVMKSELGYESELLTLSENLKKEKNKRDILNNIEEEINLRLKENELKNIQRQDAFKRYEQLRSKFENED